jgi:nucleoside-diphosphate-sugar epimerase
VKDVVKIMVQLMNSPIKNERFVLVSENLKFKTLFDLIADELGKKKPKRELSKKWAKYFLRFEQCRAFLGGNPVLTKSSLHNAYSNKCYSSEKIKKTLNYTFETMESVIKNALKDY